MHERGKFWQRQETAGAVRRAKEHVTEKVIILKHKMRFEHVLVSVDLMEVLVTQERFLEAIALGRRVYQLLEGWRIHPELRAVWYLTSEAVQKRKYQEGVFKTIREYVLRHWHRPSGRPLTEH